MRIVRVHVTFLTLWSIQSLLLPKVLTERAVVASMPFHAIPSFPERSYGYLDSEGDAADGIKMKANGSLFQGVRTRVEDARPDTYVLRRVFRKEVLREQDKRKRGKKDCDKKDCDDDRKMAKKKQRGIGTFREGGVGRLLLLHQQREMSRGIVFSEFSLLPPPPQSLPLPRLSQGVPRGKR